MSRQWYQAQGARNAQTRGKKKNAIVQPTSSFPETNQEVKLWTIYSHLFVAVATFRKSEPIDCPPWVFHQWRKSNHKCDPTFFRSLMWISLNRRRWFTNHTIYYFAWFRNDIAEQTAERRHRGGIETTLCVWSVLLSLLLSSSSVFSVFSFSFILLASAVM